jgi:dynein heavy chain
VERYNALIDLVRTSLQDLYLALRGEIVMSLEIEAILESVGRNRTPIRWLRASYLSEYSLSEYVKDLGKRTEFLKQWMETGTPRIFWLPGMEKLEQRRRQMVMSSLNK